MTSAPAPAPFPALPLRWRCTCAVACAWTALSELGSMTPLAAETGLSEAVESWDQQQQEETAQREMAMSHVNKAGFALFVLAVVAFMIFRVKRSRLCDVDGEVNDIIMKVRTDVRGSTLVRRPLPGGSPVAVADLVCVSGWLPRRSGCTTPSVRPARRSTARCPAGRVRAGCHGARRFMGGTCPIACTDAE